MTKLWRTITFYLSTSPSHHMGDGPECCHFCRKVTKTREFSWSHRWDDAEHICKKCWTAGKVSWLDVK